MSDSIVNINRQRALCSYRFIKDTYERMKDKVKSNGEEAEYWKKNIKQLRTICRKLPVLIQQNGLATTLVFLKGKEKKKNEQSEKTNIEQQIYDVIINWFVDCDYIKEDKKEKFLEELLECNMDTYMFMEKEAIEFAIWMRRNGDGIIDID